MLTVYSLLLCGTLAVLAANAETFRLEHADVEQLKLDVSEGLAAAEKSFSAKFGSENIDIIGHAYGSQAEDDVTIARFVNAIAFKGKFTASFTGSSVTLGGDCYWNQSFPWIYSSLIRGTAEKLGVDWIVRNVAQGNNPATPYDYCVGNFAGFDIDYTTWEQGMNCDSPECCELFLRNALALPGRPLVGFIEPGVAAKYAGKEGKSIHHMVGNNLEILSSYSRFGVHYFSGLQALSHLKDKTDPRFGVEHMVAERKEFGNAGWHPGPNGHEYLGHLIGITHLRFLSVAVNKISELSGDQHALSEYVNSWTVPKDLPSPITNVRNKFYFIADNYDVLPRCATIYEPRGHEEKDGDLMNYLKDPSKVVDTRGGEFDASSDRKTWTIAITPGSESALELSKHSGSPSLKWAFLGDKYSGKLEFQIATSRDGGISVCSSRRKRSSNVGALNEAALIFVDGNVIPQDRILRDDSRCFFLGEFSQGEHTVSIESTGPLITVTDLVWW